MQIIVFYITQCRRDVLRWGKNIEAGHKKAKRRAGTMVYNSASSLETLVSLAICYNADQRWKNQSIVYFGTDKLLFLLQVGYLYLTNVERLEEIMRHMGFDAEDITPRPVNSK